MRRREAEAGETKMLIWRVQNQKDGYSRVCRGARWLLGLLLGLLLSIGATSVLANQSEMVVDAKNPLMAKLSSELLHRTENPVRLNGSAADDSALSHDAILVYVSLLPGHCGQEIEALLAEVVDRDDRAGLLAARVRPDQLPALAGSAAVRFVRPVNPPLVRQGNYLSEGDRLLQAAAVRERLGSDGSGVKVGVISDGVDHLYQAQSSGDLPAGVMVLSNSEGGDEGTAMLEIIHDLAPGAQLCFHDCGSNVIAFNRAFDQLVAAGCDIIVDDIGWMTEPYFEDGLVAQHLAELAESRKVLLVSAAGNDAQGHYQGYFQAVSEGGTGTYHDFSGGRGVTRLKFLLQPGATLLAVLQWDDQFGISDNDYDLLLQAADGTILDFSQDQQSGWGDPLEYLYWTNDSSSAVEANIRIENYRGQADPKNLELFIFSGAASCLGSGYLTPDDSVYGHPAVPGVLAVGTVSLENPAAIADYSSRGPVTITLPTREIRLKPDLVGIDGVTVSGAGGFDSPFYGTSAAAPHLAAIAALLWEKSPALSAEEVKEQLQAGCVDLGQLGADPTFGAGRVDAWQAMGLSPGGEPALTVGLSRSTAAAGTSIEIAAQAEGISQPSYQFWLQSPQDQTWTVLADYQSSGNLSFTRLVPGCYQLLVFVKPATADYTAAISSQPLVVTFTGSGVNDLELSGPNGAYAEQTAAVFTAQASSAGGNPRYQFWCHDQAGWRQLGDYTEQNVLQLPGLVTGSYVIAVCALDRDDLLAGKWSAAYSRSCLLNVGSRVQLTVPASGSIGSPVILAAATSGLTGGEYQFWYQAPDQSWHQSGGYQSSGLYSFIPAVPGNYRVVVYAKDHYAPATEQYAVTAGAVIKVS